MIRLVADSGGIIHGGLAQVGRVGVTCASRSCTSCRARISSVPRSKISRIEDSCETDFERSSSSPGSPLSCSSIGTVISSSTSLEELPSAIVWISTRGGANSGKTSTFACGIWAMPKAIIAAAAKITSHRNRRLLATIQRISAAFPARSMARDLELGAVHLGGPDRHDRRARRRAARQQRPDRPRCGRTCTSARRYVERARAACRRTSSRRGRRSAPRRGRPCAPRCGARSPSEAGRWPLPP